MGFRSLTLRCVLELMANIVFCSRKSSLRGLLCVREMSVFRFFCFCHVSLQCSPRASVPRAALFDSRFLLRFVVLQTPESLVSFFLP